MDRTRRGVDRADLYPRVLIRPVCGGCGTPMILGRSVGKYQSFCCHNANSGIKGCTNRGYKSARIIYEAVLIKAEEMSRWRSGTNSRNFIERADGPA